MPDSSIYFAFPGDLDTPTGGYHYDRRLISELRKAGIVVKTVPLPHCAPALDHATRKTVREILAALPDQAIVLIDGLAFGVLDDLAQAEARRLRLIALCHHPLALETGLDERQSQALEISERRALACARATVVTSEHTRRTLIDQFAVPAEKIVVALPGTDRVAFAPCDGDPLRLLCVASLIPRKAHDVLIDALATLKDLPWRARFVGGGDFDPAWAVRLRAQADSLGLSQRLCFAGPVADTQAEYQQADVFVLPSRFEGYGMAFAEALAAGLPVIAAHAGAVPDVVPDSAGLLVVPDDARALSAVLRQVLTDEPLRRRLQTGARHAAATLPSWSDTAGLVAARVEEVRSA
ncbi:MAG: glycosyltransferase family 4 protein [Pseudohongiellaceae bacterium]